MGLITTIVFKSYQALKKAVFLFNVISPPKNGKALVLALADFIRILELQKNLLPILNGDKVS